MIDEGDSARQVLETSPAGVIRAVRVGFVDSVNIYRADPASCGS